MIGRAVGGRFTVQRRLGSGGMGAVYAATQHSMGRAVALKIMHPRLAAHTDAARRFVREARLAATLAHPNIVGVIDFGQDPDGTLYIAMELLEGPGLDAVIAADGPLSVPRAARIGVQICDALAAAHRRGIVHRDLKPANVIVVEPGAGRDVLKVVDFGLAKSLDGDQSTLTRPGQTFGSPAYLSPEMVSGREVEGAADLYALGVMLFEMVEGRVPFAADTLQELAIKHALAAPPPLTVQGPASFAVVVRRLLEKDPTARYPSAEAARDALTTALADVGGARAPREARVIEPAAPGAGQGQGTATTPAETVASSAPTWPPPGRRWAALVAVGAALVVVALIAWWFSGAGGESGSGAPAGATSAVDVAASGGIGGEPDASISEAAVATQRDTVVASQHDAAVASQRDTAAAAVASDVAFEAGAGDAAAADASAVSGGPDALGPAGDAVALGPAGDTIATVAATVASRITLRLRSSPLADVAVDGVPRGRTPIALRLSRRARRHTVRFEAAGYKAVVRTVPGDADGVLSVDLEPTFIPPP
jgi:serine/threonine-protein kinase